MDNNLQFQSKQPDIVTQVLSSEINVNSVDEVVIKQFREDVQKWIDMDNDLKRLQIAIKLRKQKHDELTQKIQLFMEKNNLEDLETKDGVIRYKKTVVQSPLSQKTIKIKLNELLVNNTELLNTVNNIFLDKTKVEKCKLKRIQS